MTGALKAFDTHLERGDGASPTEAFTKIAEIKSISGPGLSADALDASNMASPGGFREFIAGLRDGGEITLEINFIPAEATHKDASGGMLNDYKTGAKGNWQISFPDSPTTKWVMPCIITGFEISAPVDDLLSASVTFKVAGQPTLA